MTAVVASSPEPLTTHALLGVCDALERSSSQHEASSQCLHLCASLSSWADIVKAEDVVQFLQVIVRCFQVCSATDQIEELCSQAAVSLEAVQRVMRDMPSVGEYAALLQGVQALIDALQTFALPRVTDRTWAERLGPAYAAYVHTCTVAVGHVSACLCIVVASQGARLRPEVLAAVSQWVRALSQLAAAALQLASDADAPPQMKVFSLINTIWREITALPAGLPPDVTPAIAEAFQGTFASAWSHFMVRRRGRHCVLVAKRACRPARKRGVRPVQANTQAMLQHADDAGAAVDAQQLKLARFWLQNAHKLLTAIPACADLHVDRLVSALAALHACTAATPAAEDALANGYAAALHVLAHYLLPRCRTCCLAALAAMPAAAMHNMLRDLCTCAPACVASSLLYYATLPSLLEWSCPTASSQ